MIRAYDPRRHSGIPILASVWQGVGAAHAKDLRILSEYRGVVEEYRGVVEECRGVVEEYRGVVEEYRGVVEEYRGGIRSVRAQVHVHYDY